jgi:hypothetical protein
MTDDLTFTTTLSASANPAAVFTPIGTAFQLADVSLTAAVSRSDVHQVTVGVAIDKTRIKHLASVRSVFFSERRESSGLVSPGPAALSGRLYIGNRVIGGGTRAEQLAVIAIDQAKSQQVQLVRGPGL